MTLSLLAFLFAGCGTPSSEPLDHAHGPDAGHDDHDDHDDHDAARIIELSEEAMVSARIRVDEAGVGELGDSRTMPARITLDPRKEAVVSAWISGQVDHIAVRPGASVRRGQRLASVQSPELGEAVAAYRTASARDAAADARLERLRRLEADGVTSGAQVLEAEADHTEAEGALEAAEERLRVMGMGLDFGDPHAGEHFPSRVPVTSPIAGKVLTTDISVGARVEPGQTLFHVGDLDQVWLMLDLYERDLASVREGQDVRFTVEAWPDQSFHGSVAQVGDWVEPDARTIEVRVVVENPDHRLKPNMFAQAMLDVPQRDRVAGVLLPAGAVSELDGEHVVFVEVEPRHFRPQSVQLAQRTAAEVLLAAGLDAGTRVVTEGAFALKSELERGELGHGHAH